MSEKYEIRPIHVCEIEKFIVYLELDWTSFPKLFRNNTPIENFFPFYNELIIDENTEKYGDKIRELINKNIPWKKPFILEDLEISHKDGVNIPLIVSMWGNNCLSWNNNEYKITIVIGKLLFHGEIALIFPCEDKNLKYKDLTYKCKIGYLPEKIRKLIKKVPVKFNAPDGSLLTTDGGVIYKYHLKNIISPEIYAREYYPEKIKLTLEEYDLYTKIIKT